MNSCQAIQEGTNLGIPPLVGLCHEYFFEPRELLTVAHGRVAAFSEDLQKRIRAASESIVELDFRGDTEITGEDVRALALECKQLRRLDLRGCTGLQAASWDTFQFVDLDDELEGHQGFHMLRTAFQLHASICVQVSDTQELIFSHGENAAVERRIQYVTTQSRASRAIDQLRASDFEAASLAPYTLKVGAQNSFAHSTIRTQQRDALQQEMVTRTLSLGKELLLPRRA